MSEFHFLRSWWLIAILPAMFVVWRLWAIEDSTRVWRQLVAPHLLPRLLVGRQQHHWLRPALVIFAAWIGAAIALAGPTWEREPAPFADDTASLAIVLKVTPSMQSQDVQPTRQERAAQKIHDLLELRPGAKTALFAYAGSAHRVMPLTSDAGIISTFAGELSPEVMPVEGSVAATALTTADESLTKSGQTAWILWIADAATPDEIQALKQYQSENRTPVSILAVAGDGPELESLKQAATALNTPLVQVTPDDADVQQLAANTKFSTVTEQAGGDRWRDFGYWLAWPLAVVALLGFRRGWMVHVAGGAG